MPRPESARTARARPAALRPRSPPRSPCPWHQARGSRVVASVAVERPALLMIDVQREYFDRDSTLWIPDGPVVLERLAGLLVEARRIGTGVVHVQHHESPGADVFAPGTPAVETMDEVAAEGDETVVVKHLPGAFDGTSLDALLE